MKKWIVKGIVLSLFIGANAQALTRSQHDTAVGAGIRWGRGRSGG